MKRKLVVTVLLLSMSLCGCSRKTSYEEAAANMTVATEYVVTDEQAVTEEEAQEEEQKLCQVVFNSDSITRSDLATSGLLERYSWYRSQGYTEDDKCNPMVYVMNLMGLIEPYNQGVVPNVIVTTHVSIFGVLVECTKSL